MWIKMVSVHTVVGLVSVLCFTISVAEEEPVIPGVDHPFPVHIGAEGHVVQGRILSTAAPGTVIPYDIIMEGREDSDLSSFLRVEVRDSVYTRPHVFHPEIKVNTSDPGNPQFEHPVITFPNSTLPPGMEFVVIKSNAFIVNKERYIVVNDFGGLADDENLRIHFDVILKDTLSQVHYVSNHLPFVVEIEIPHHTQSQNSVLFAGVLILTIVAISLLIPFVVRAKRRSKAGKPVCGCGSADDSSSTGSTHDMMKGRVLAGGGKDNLAMILDHGGRMGHRPSVDPHTTIQNAMLRSTSNINFQPHWMDPHYRDVYNRPDYDYANQSLAPPSNHGYYNPAFGGRNPAFVRDANSSRSSLDSRYEYPANFNKNVHHNGRIYEKAHHSSHGTNGGLPAKRKADGANGGVATVSQGRLGNPVVTVTDAEHQEMGVVMQDPATAGDSHTKITFDERM